MKSLFFLLLIGLQAIVTAKDVNILDYGANPDGKTLTTEMIQKAIDQCAETGGGTVNVPPGTYLTTSLFLRNGINLPIQNGAPLLGHRFQSI